MRIRFEQLEAGHDHPGRTEAALQAGVPGERGLQRIEGLAPAHSLDGGDLRAGRLDREEEARADRQAVEPDRAGSADPVLAADMGARETEVVAEHVRQEPARLDATGEALAVDRELDGDRHLHR